MTLQGFNNDYINKLYQQVILYSIKYYQSLPKEMQLQYKEKYDKALLLQAKFGLDSNESLEELKEFLDNEKSKIEMIKEENQPIIDMFANNILGLILIKMPSDLTDIEKCEYIFDYVTNTMEYADEWKRYCIDVPQNEYNFCFYSGVPLSKTYEGLLVTKKGNSDDIANLITYLGKRVGVNIEKTFCRHHNNTYAINYIVQKDKTVSYFDAASVIRNEKSKDEIFLVSERVLAKDMEYQLKNHQMSVSLKRPTIEYNIDNLINEIKKMEPQINYATSKIKEK